jgi:DNA repair exonuclease SbcCD nuclease subunit
MDRPDWQEITLPDLPLVIHGFAFDDFHISRNPFQSMPRIAADGRTHIMLCHGTEVGHAPSSAKNHAPLDAALLPSELSYCALGHFHERTDASALGSPPVWYPGVPQPFRFVQASGSYLRVTIDNGQANVEPVNTKNLPLRTHTHKLESGDSIDTLTAQLRETGNGCILALSLTGSWPSIARSDISARIATLRQEGFLIYIADWNVAERSDYGDLEARQDALGDFCVSVADELKDAPSEEQAALFRARDMGIAILSNPSLPLVSMGGEG